MNLDKERATYHKVFYLQIILALAMFYIVLSELGQITSELNRQEKELYKVEIRIAKKMEKFCKKHTVTEKEVRHFF